MTKARSSTKARTKNGAHSSTIAQLKKLLGARGDASPTGRTLAYFEPLNDAEQKLLEACATGTSCDLVAEKANNWAEIDDLLSDDSIATRFSAAIDEPLNDFGTLPRPLLALLTDYNRLARIEANLATDWAPTNDEEATLLSNHILAILPQYRTWRYAKTRRSNKIRGDFLRFLCLGGDGENTVDDQGIQLVGANVDGDLWLDGATIQRPISITKSYFEGAVSLTDSRAMTVDLSGSCVEFIFANRSKINGALLLGSGFCARHYVDVSQSTIEHGV